MVAEQLVQTTASERYRVGASPMATGFLVLPTFEDIKNMNPVKLKELLLQQVKGEINGLENVTGDGQNQHTAEKPRQPRAEHPQAEQGQQQQAGQEVHVPDSPLGEIDENIFDDVPPTRRAQPVPPEPTGTEHAIYG